jgi:hypothetical protein
MEAKMAAAAMAVGTWIRLPYRSTVRRVEVLIDVDNARLEKKKQELIADKAAVSCRKVLAELRKVLLNAPFLCPKHAVGR